MPSLSSCRTVLWEEAGRGRGLFHACCCPADGLWGLLLAPLQIGQWRGLLPVHSSSSVSPALHVVNVCTSTCSMHCQELLLMPCGLRG